MNPRNLFAEALKLGVPKPTPASLWGGGVWAFTLVGASYPELIRSPQRLAEVIISVNEKAGSAAVFVGSGFTNFPVAALGATLVFKERGAPAVEGVVVKKLAEADTLDLDRLDEDEALNTLRIAARLVKDEIGEETFVTAVAWGPFTFAGRLFGVEQLMVAMLEDPAGVKALVGVAAEAVWRFFAPYLADGSIHAIALADPVASGDLISRSHFQEFAQPVLAQITARAKDKDVPVLLHICGRTDDRLDLIAEAGVSAFCLDHRVDLGQALEKLQGRVCLGGNVAPVEVMLQGTPADVTTAARRCLDTAAESGGYILMPGCDLPPDVPLENVQALMQAAWG